MEILISVIITLIAGGLTLLIWKPISRVKSHHIVDAKNTAVVAVKKRQALILKIVVVIVVCSITLFLTNTQIKKVGKNAYINNFEEFVEKVKVNHTEYSADDWIKIDKEYQKFEEEDRIKYEILIPADVGTRSRHHYDHTTGNHIVIRSYFDVQPRSLNSQPGNLNSH